MLAAATAAFFAVLIAEIGDKTQLVSLTMSCRYPPLQVLAGAMSALALVIGLSVWVGSFVFTYVPPALVTLIAGSLFIAIGLLTYLRRERPEEKCSTGRTGFLQTMAMIFVAELGDKTQLAAILLTASFGFPWAVFGGAMLAMLVNHLLAVYLGSRFLARISPGLLRVGTAVLFIIIGVIIVLTEHVTIN